MSFFIINVLFNKQLFMKALSGICSRELGAAGFGTAGDDRHTSQDLNDRLLRRSWKESEKARHHVGAFCISSTDWLARHAAEFCLSSTPAGSSATDLSAVCCGAKVNARKEWTIVFSMVEWYIGPFASHFPWKCLTQKPGFVLFSSCCSALRWSMPAGFSRDRSRSKWR